MWNVFDAFWAASFVNEFAALFQRMEEQELEEHARASQYQQVKRVVD